MLESPFRAGGPARIVLEGTATVTGNQDNPEAQREAADGAPQVNHYTEPGTNPMVGNRVHFLLEGRLDGHGENIGESCA